MAWPATAVATGELITAAQLNGLPVMIANTTLGGDAANIDFTSVPGHYAHLMLVCYLRSDIAAANTPVYIRLNNDSGGNYDWQFIQGSAAVASAGEAFAQTAGQIGVMPANSAGANLFNAGQIVIPHYAGSANNKSVECEWAYKTGTTTGLLSVGALALHWRSSAAVTRVTVLPTSGNLRSGSRATLYGLA
jgi:hypothetical protein